MDVNAPTFVGAIKDVVTIALGAFFCAIPVGIYVVMVTIKRPVF